MFTIGKVPLSLSIEGAYYQARPEDAARFVLGLEVNWVLPQKHNKAR